VAKQKTTKKPAPTSLGIDCETEVVVTWRNTFNCDRSAVQNMDRQVAAAIVRQAGYEFMAHNHRVYLIHPSEAPEALGRDAEELDAGLVVRMTADKKLIDVRPRDKKKYVVMAISREYNDEYYYRLDGDAGRPESVFDTKPEAEAEAHRRNIKQRAARSASSATPSRVRRPRPTRECTPPCLGSDWGWRRNRTRPRRLSRSSRWRAPATSPARRSGRDRSTFW